MESYVICDKCGENVTITYPRKHKDRVFTICWDCMREIEKNEDRLMVLEGFVECVQDMAAPIAKI